MNSCWKFLIQDPGAVCVHQPVHNFKLNAVLANWPVNGVVSYGNLNVLFKGCNLT